MEKLIDYIEMVLKWTKQTPQYAHTFFNQAFGALQFYIIEQNISGDKFAELETLWNEKYRPQFEEIMYGGAKND
jgi:hypothetical protein